MQLLAQTAIDGISKKYQSQLISLIAVTYIRSFSCKYYSTYAMVIEHATTGAN